MYSWRSEKDKIYALECGNHMGNMYLDTCEYIYTLLIHPATTTVVEIKNI